MRRYAIIVAGGSGSRMGGPIPKQYLELAGKPVILHTLERFLDFDPGMELVVVLGKDQGKYWEPLVEEFGLLSKVSTTAGGPTRFESVRNGLGLLKGEGLVGIHDAARPLVSRATLERAYEAAGEKGSGIPLIAVTESVRVKEDGSYKSLDRSLLRLVQTPQTFRLSRIREAFRQAERNDFSDDASVYERYFGNPAFVEGNRENIKITTEEDLRLAGALLGQLS